MAEPTDAAAEPLPLLPGERPPRPDAVKVRVTDDGTPHHHTARTKARKAALDALYQADIRGVDPLDLLEDASPPARPFTQQIVRGVRFHGARIDQRIAESLAPDWTLERMPSVDRALARIATWEIEHTDAPDPTAIAEALSLADEYSTDDSVSFLNGLLGRIAATASRRREPTG